MHICDDRGAPPAHVWSGLRAAIGSVAEPGVYFGDIQEVRDLARACNEFAAE